MKKTVLQLTTAAWALTLMASALPAQVLGVYEFDNTDGTNSAPADKMVSNPAANVTFSDFFRVGAIEDNSGKGAGNANRLATFGWNLGSQDWNDILYVGFTVTAAPGFSLNLASLSLDYNRANSSNSPRDGRLLVGTGGILTATPFTLFNNSFSGSNADISVGPVDLSAFSGETSYNIYFQFSDSDTSTRLIRLDNVELSGEVVPEPTTGVLLLAGLGVAALRRRR